MNKNLIFIYLMIAVLLSLNVSAQENFVNGYIKSNQGDTIKGYIDDQDWDKNPDLIKFKSIEGNITVYHPNDIQGFGVKSNQYVSATVFFETSSLSIEKLNQDSSLHYSTGLVFLTKLISGEKSLYEFKDKDGRDNFYIQKGKNDPELLIYKKYIGSNNGRTVIMENNKYVGQLRLYLSDCLSIQTKLVNITYEAKSLKNLFDFYYSCTKKQANYQQQAEKVKGQIGFFGGVSYGGIKFNGNNSDYLTKANFSSSFNPSLGLYYDLFLRKNNQRNILHTELQVSSYHSKGSYTDYRSSDQYYIYDSDLAFTYMKLNLNFRHRYDLKPEHSIFYNIGISNGFVIKEKNEMTKFSKFYTTESTDYLKALDDARKYEQGLIFSGGYQIKKLSLEARFEISNGISKITNLKSSDSKLMLLLGYRIN